MFLKLCFSLLAKNVASDIAVKLCDSVATKLEGKVLSTFSGEFIDIDKIDIDIDKVSIMYSYYFLLLLLINQNAYISL